MRSISPIVAIVILLLMTIAAAGLAYLTIRAFQQQTGVSGEAGLQQLTSSMRTQLKIESVSGGKIYVRNLGSDRLRGTSFFIQGQPLNVSGPAECNTGELCVFSVSESVTCQDKVQISMGRDMPMGSSVRVNCDELKFEGTLTFSAAGSQIVNITLPLLKTVSSATLDLAGSRAWSSNEDISLNSGLSYNPYPAIDPSGNLHVVWNDNTYGIYEIFYANRTRGVWSSPINVSQMLGTSTEPNLAFDPSGNLHVVWQNLYSGNKEVFYANRTGGVWSTPFDVSQAPGVSDYARLAIDSSGNLHVVWQDYFPGNFEVFYANRTGGVWSSPLNISQMAGDSSYPSFVLDAFGNPHVVWTDTGLSHTTVVYVNRTGGVWSSPLDISPDLVSPWSPDHPHIAFDSSGNPHVVWADNHPGNFEIFYVNRTGGVWSSSLNISNNSGTSSSPHIAIGSSGDAHVIWQDSTPGNFEIFYVNRTGGVWSSSLNISRNSGTSQQSQLAFDAFGNLHVVWADNTVGNYEIFYTSLTSADNPTMIAGSYGSADWSYSNSFNMTSSVPDFSTKLTSLLSTCSCPSCWSDGTHCTIGLNFTSQSAGVIQLSGLDVVYS